MKKFTAIFITLILILTTVVSAVDMSDVDIKNFDWRSFKGLNVPFARGDYYAKTVKKIIDEENFIGFVGLDNEDEKYYLSYYEGYYKGKGDVTLYDMWYYSAYNYAGELVEKLAKDYIKEDARHAFDGNQYGTEIYSYEFTYTADDGRRMRRVLSILKYGEDLYIYEHENKEELFNENNASSDSNLRYKCFFGEPIENFEENKDEMKPPEKPIDIIINGEMIETDSNPLIVNDRTMVPVRTIADGLGYNVGWDANTRTVTLEKEKITLKIGINHDIIRKQYVEYDKSLGMDITKNEEVKADVPAQIINDRTYLPVRAVSEALGCSVEWDGQARTINIKTFEKEEVKIETVYIGETGNEYHKYRNCTKLPNNSGAGMPYDFAVNQGRTPCALCWE